MPRDGVNTTVSDAGSIRGTNPQFLLEKITRMKVYETQYWKEHCFALNAEGVVDKAVDLKYVAGVMGGNTKPSEFLCLLLKMLQIVPEKSIILEFIANDDYKYVRILGALYLRMTGTPLEVYQYLEPLLADYRKVRCKDRMGKFHISHVDEIVDTLLTEPTAFDITLPRMPLRRQLEKSGKLGKRKTMLEEMDLLADVQQGGEGGRAAGTDKDGFLQLKQNGKQEIKAIGWRAPTGSPEASVRDGGNGGKQSAEMAREKELEGAPPSEPKKRRSPKRRRRSSHERSRRRRRSPSRSRSSSRSSSRSRSRSRGRRRRRSRGDSREGRRRDRQRREGQRRRDSRRDRRSRSKSGSRRGRDRRR